MTDQAGLSLNWSQTPKTGFLVTRLIYKPILFVRPPDFSSFMIQHCATLSMFLSSHLHMDRVKRIWYLSPMRAAKVQASLRIRAVSPEPPLLAHTSSESSGTFRQKASSLAPLNGWACAVKICHDGMLEDTNSLDVAHVMFSLGRAWVRSWQNLLKP